MHRAAPLVLLTALLTLSACGLKSGEDGGVNPDVPATASPEEVVEGYLQALQDHDEEGAVALTTHAYGWGDSWSTEPPEIDDVEIGAVQPYDLEGPAQNEYDDGVSVPVSVTLRRAEGAPDGPADLTFTVWRGRVNDRWLIAGLTRHTAAGDVPYG